MNWEKIKLGLWSAIGGAVVLAIIGFTWGGWVSGGTAREMAEEMREVVIDKFSYRSTIDTFLRTMSAYLKEACK